MENSSFSQNQEKATKSESGWYTFGKATIQNRAITYNPKPGPPNPKSVYVINLGREVLEVFSGVV